MVEYESYIVEAITPIGPREAQPEVYVLATCKMGEEDESRQGSAKAPSKTRGGATATAN